MTRDDQQLAPLASIATRQIELRGVRVHNLKSLDLDIPLGRFVVLSGVSGSGKSSLAFDTLFAEGQRRYIESFSIAARQHLERIERPDADRIAHVPPAIAIRSDQVRRNRIDGRSTVATVADLLDGLRLLYARAGQIICPGCQSEIRSHSTTDVVQAISELPAGTRCQIGFAVPAITDSESSLEAPNPVASWLARGFSRAIWDGVTVDLNSKPAWPASGDIWLVVDRIVAGKTSSDRLLESATVALREGGGRCVLFTESGDNADADTRPIDARLWSVKPFDRRLVCPRCRLEFLPLEPRLLSHLSSGACQTCKGSGEGGAGDQEGVTCQVCAGTRFRAEARAVLIAGHSISDLLHQNSRSVIAWVRGLRKLLSAGQKQTIERMLRDLEQRLQAVCDLGLDYLPLDRTAGTLSGGETRRLMLAAVIGSQVTGMLVVVDEPSAGLAETELPQVIAALRRVRDLRNSVIAVEHAPLVVAAADHVIELGPGAGPAGGNLVYQGSPLSITPAATPATASPGGQKKEKITEAKNLSLKNVQHRNLQQVDVVFGVGKLNVVTGPSGGGKTSLVTHVIYPAVRQRLGLSCEISTVGTCSLTGGSEWVDAVLVDQSPLTRSSRSNPATWLEVFDEIRQTFAATIDARQRGFTAQQFSFNSSRGGRCRSCLGTGLLKQDLQFLPDIILVCSECHGTRYRREILEVKYRSRSIAEVLAMSVSDAALFFRSQPRLQLRFQMLKQIGLDYLVLGQPSETLSGGEAQRLKLTARLTAPSRGPCLILCDEPTTGLHPADVGRLISCFRELIANGHTVILADNSPELISAADWVVRLENGAVTWENQ
jgi:excinuclease ABC subunit A